MPSDSPPPSRPKPVVIQGSDGADELGPVADEPPVVARLMIEIRSDGTRTIARGALEDLPSGQRVAITAAGSTPAELALSLAKTLLSAPTLAKHALRALLQKAKKT